MITRPKPIFPHTSLILSFLLLAGVNNSYAAELPSMGGDTGSILRMIWGLLVVLGVIFIIYGLLKKRFSLLSASPNQNINVVEIKPLMGKKAICLVEVKGQEYLLGLGADNVTHIATLPGNSGGSFAETLAQSEEKL